MTQVSTTLRSAYLAGPMRGIEDYNFPAFRMYTAWLRAEGWKVFSPAERDEADPDIDHTENVAGWNGSRGLDYFMAHDLKAVCETDAVICLPGWEASQGARLETVTAVEVGHPVFVIEDERSRGGFVESRHLVWIDPEHIHRVFTNRGVVGNDQELAANWETHAPFACRCGGSLTSECEGYQPNAAAVEETGDWEMPESINPGVGIITDMKVDGDALVVEGEAGEMRAFTTGATRNKEVDPDIYGFTSPLALGLFAEYMHANRTQADGTIRDSDNWKRGIPLDSYIRSMRRHLQDLTLIHDGYPELARESIEAALGGLFFNVQGYAHEAVKQGVEERRNDGKAEA